MAAAIHRLRYIAAFVCVCIAWSMSAQVAGTACGPAPVVAGNAQPNIFSEQQEQWLGEAMADSLEGDITPIRDRTLSAHLQAIADRLLTTLPPTQIKFRVMLIESSDVNGYSIAGGHIYLTRKLASAAQNDDELAGVIGHEIGHIASHQFAFETTRDLKRLLNVTSVGDRADVYARYHALMDARLRDKHPAPSESDKGQDEADRIGVFAIAAAGYKPDASSQFWDRVFFVGGKTRGKVADFFGITKPNEKRLRSLRELAAAIPAGCGRMLTADANEFALWHNAVVANQSGAAAASSAVKEVTLTQPLRMELDQVRFSPDGRWVLAQDESSIFVLSREPLAMRFRIDASGALPAHFSPDSKAVTFSTPGLHTEQWSIESKQLIAAHELLWKDRCYETKLAPDGRTLVCVGMNLDNLELSLTLLDTENSQVVWQKKDWVQAGWGVVWSYVFQNGGEASSRSILYSAYSPDNNVLLIGSGFAKMAFDLRNRSVFKIGSGLQNSTTGEYAFVGNDKVVVQNSAEFKRSAVFSFPEGKQLRTLAIPNLPMRGVTNPGSDLRVVLFGNKDFDAALGDLGAAKLVLAIKTHALDEYGDLLVGETEGGGVSLLKAGDTDLKHQIIAPLPLSPLASLRAVAMSPDGKYLAASTHYRGGLWDAQTGKQMAMTYGFRDAAWSDDGSVYLEMTDLPGSERHVKQISMTARKAADLTYKVDDTIRMRFGRLTEWKQDDKKKTWTLALHDPADNKVLWTRNFRDAHMGYSASYGDRDLLFSFGLKSNTAREAMKADSKLAAQALGIKDKDAGRLVKVLDAKTGDEDGSLVLEVPPTYAGLDGVNRAGDLVYLTGVDDRTTVYSMASGKELRKLFGVVMALDPGTGRVCTANRVGEAVVYDASGAELAHFNEGEPLRYAVFRQGATVLTVLTAKQQIRTLAVPGGPTPDRTEKAEAAEAK